MEEKYVTVYDEQFGSINVFYRYPYGGRMKIPYQATKRLASGTFKLRCQATVPNQYRSSQCERSGSYLEEAHETNTYGTWVALTKIAPNPVRNERGEVIGYESSYYGRRIKVFPPSVKFYYCKQHSMEEHNAKEKAAEEQRRLSLAYREARVEAFTVRQNAINSLLTIMNQYPEELPENIQRLLKAVEESGLTGMVHLSREYHQ